MNWVLRILKEYYDLCSGDKSIIYNKVYSLKKIVLKYLGVNCHGI